MSVYPSQLIENLKQERTAIEAWFEQKWQHLTPPFYTSVDLRHSGFKLAPIDVNLYPAGFNNLAPEDESLAVRTVHHMLKERYPNCERILIITENHTRNLYYLAHLAKLKDLLNQAGFTVKLSMLNTLSQTVHTPEGQPLVLESVTKKLDYLHIGDFTPDCIILNNDLSEGFPELLNNISQPILPAPTLGWYQRRKSHYFEKYNAVCQAFSEAFGWDDWLINPLFSHCDHVNFTKVSEQTELFDHAQQLLEKITAKYQHYNIPQKPYLIIKADSGSYGMGVLSIDDAASVTHLSRKHRQHMAKTKGNRLIQNVILQEGVPTITEWNQFPAEPVIYFFGKTPIGGFYRTHTTRNHKENLNTPGMQLTPLALHRAYDQPHSDLLDAYQVIARLATLAAALEIKDIEKTNPLS